MAPTNEYRTFDLHEAAAYLRMSPAVLRGKARAGVIRGAKPGKRWVFLEADLAAYLRSLYPVPGQALQGGHTEVQVCRSTNAVVRGGSGLRPPMGSEYAALLGLKTE